MNASYTWNVYGGALFSGAYMYVRTDVDDQGYFDVDGVRLASKPCRGRLLYRIRVKPKVRTGQEPIMTKFERGDRVKKKKGAAWHGVVCGEYSTALTPEGYAVESEREPGSVQIYPAGALDPVIEQGDR